MPGANEFSVQEIFNRIFDPTNNRLNISGLFDTFRGIALNAVLWLPTNANWTEAVTGSGASGVAPGELFVRTGTTTGSTARRYTTDILLPGAGTPVNFANRIIWGFMARRATADAAVIGRIQLKAATTEGALAARGIGIRIANLTMTGEGYETEDAFTATIQTMVAGSNYWIVVDHEPAVPRTRFYVDGVLQATQSTSANVPQTATGSVGAIISVLNGAGTADVFASLNAMFLLQAL